MYQIPRTQPLPKRLTIGVLKGVVDFLYQQGVVGVPGPNDKQRKTLLNRLGDLNLWFDRLINHLNGTHGKHPPYAMDALSNAATFASEEQR
jgi:hypothetical protein